MRRLTNSRFGIETIVILERAFYFCDKAKHFAVDVFGKGRYFLQHAKDFHMKPFALSMIELKTL